MYLIKPMLVLAALTHKAALIKTLGLSGLALRPCSA